VAETDPQAQDWKVQEVVDGIWAIESRLGPRAFFQHVCLDERALLVDAGVRTTAAAILEPALGQLDAADRLAYVTITHADVDHCGGAAEILAAHPRAALTAHEADRVWVEQPQRLHVERYGWYEAEGLGYPQSAVDWLASEAGGEARVELAIRGGERIALGPRLTLSLLHLPGHTAGHIGLFEPTSRTALIGDAVLARGLVDGEGEVVQPPSYFDRRAYRTTIASVRALDADRLLTAHYPPLEGGAVREFLDAAEAFDEELAAVVGDALRAGGTLSLAEVTAAADERLGPFSSMPNELAGPVRCHLDELVVRGEASRHQGRPARWSAR